MIGIEWIELYIPDTKVSQVELAHYNNVDPEKYTIGLGQTSMATCKDCQDIVAMHLTVCSRVLARYGQRFGFLGVGTETIMDRSKSIKSQLLPLFDKSRPQPHYGLDTYNACYGGTASLLHALAWLQSDQWAESAPLAMVLCGDIAAYQHPHEMPTGGCGVIAMVVSKDPVVAIDTKSLVHDMKHCWDFYKPRRDSEYPVVNGALSQQCYLDAVHNTYQQFKTKCTESMDFVLFHHPYNKLVQKAFASIQQLSSSTMDHRAIADGCYLSKLIGNIYTGSLYLTLASLAYCKSPEELFQKKVLMFSYGSGYMASMFSLQFVDHRRSLVDKKHIHAMLDNQTFISVQQFLANMANNNTMFHMMDGCPVDDANHDAINAIYVLTSISNGIRKYKQTNDRI